jgi:hypothetical protein
MLLTFLLCPMLAAAAMLALLCALPYLAARLESGHVDGPAMGLQSWEDLETELDVAAGWDVLLAARPCRRSARVRRAYTVFRPVKRRATLACTMHATPWHETASVRNCLIGKGHAIRGPPLARFRKCAESLGNSATTPLPPSSGP